MPFLATLANHSTKKQGFTLLELLVVVSIIGILIAIGLPAFSTAQQKSRDATRRADIKSTQNGFEQYYGANSEYADCATMGSSASFPAGLPEDPRNGIYICSGAATGYCICAELETGNGNSTANDCSAGLTPPTDTSDYFCATNLQ